MLERPPIEDERIVACLRQAYDLIIGELTFLPLGADTETAVYRAVARDATPYFVKLRSGAFDESAVVVPRFLSDLGIRAIIAPLPTTAGRLWAEVGAYRLILYPFVESRDAYEVELSPDQWRELGAALRRIHDAGLPPAPVRREEFSPRRRERLAEFLRIIETTPYADPVAAEMAAYLNEKRREITALIDHAGRLAKELRARQSPFVLCHSDLHAGNVVIDGAGRLYVVDWDQPILAPRERDLMYPGGAQGFRGHAPEEEERLFFDGYGPVEVDAAAVAYYRFERIVEDLAVFAEQLLLSDEGGADRRQSIRYVKSNFLPGGTIERAYAAGAAAEADRGRDARPFPYGE